MSADDSTKKLAIISFLTSSARLLNAQENPIYNRLITTSVRAEINVAPMELLDSPEEMSLNAWHVIFISE
jgi:hypothetical protein